MDGGNTLIVIILLFVVLGDTAAEASCADGDPQSTSLKLRKILFCEYDRNIQPVKNHTAITDVSVFLAPKFLVFYDFFDTLQVHSWMALRWLDETLTWNKTEYDGIKALTVPSGKIWLPDLDIDELSDNELMGHRIDNVPCTLEYTGQVDCLVAVTHSALCDADVRRWPFDQHTCTITLESWSRAESLNLSTTSEGISTKLYKQSREWDLLNASVKHDAYPNDNQTPISRLTYSLTLKRFSGEGASGVFVPAIVLATLTCLTFLLRSNSSERLGLICFNILAQCSYLLHICFRIPPNGDSVPLLLLFYRDSLVMAAVSLIITLLVRKMDAAEGLPPVWVAGVVNGVLATLPGQMLLLNGVDPKGVAAVVDSENATAGSGTSRWRLFGALTDYVSLLACVLATLVFLVKFLL